MDEKFAISNEDLNFAAERGILDVGQVREQIEDMRRKELLSQHPYKIWQGKDGAYYTYLACSCRNRKLVHRASLENLQDVIAEHYRQQIENPSIAELFQEWLAAKNISEATRERYQCDFRRFFDTKFQNRKIKTITAYEVECFMRNCLKKYHLTAKAFGNLRTLVLGVFGLAHKKGFIDFSIKSVMGEMDISRNDFRHKVTTDEQEVFMTDEEPLVMDYISKHPDMMNLAVGILFRTGLRVGELVALQKDDCKGNQLFVHATETRIKDKHGSYHYEVKPTPKTDAGIRTVILPDNARWMLEQLLSMNPSGKYLFERPSGKRLHAYHIRGRLYYICDQCDIPRRSPHKIRKTYATILLDNHVDTTLITSQMGHTDILTTEHFYHRDRRDMDAKAAIINALPDFQ